MILNVTNIPSTPRSKHYQKLTFSSSNGIVVNEGTQVDNPFSYTSDGNLILTDKKLYFNDSYIDSAKVISWDNAVSMAHQHTNKSYLDSINQSLSSSSVVQFNRIKTNELFTQDSDLNITRYGSSGNTNLLVGSYAVQASRLIVQDSLSVSGETNLNGYTNANGILNRGVLNMNNNNVWAVSNVDFNAYETEGVVKWNTISNLGSLGFGFNNRINVGGNIELSGTNKDIFTNNGDIALVRYRSDWSVGSQIRLRSNDVAVNNLSVEGALNCYELVANKVRSTNGYLYVTDSTPVLDVLYIGYNNKGEAEAKVKIESGRLQEGDYIILQKFTGKQIIKMTFFCSWAETAENMFIVNKDGLTTEQLRVNLAINDVLVRVDNANIADRRTGILLSPYDGGYIDFYKGAGDGLNKTITTSIGNLDHLPISLTRGLTGMGLYCDNAYIKGKIYATDLQFDGTIDGNKINAESLVAKNLKTAETGVKIEASGNQLKMLDANDKVKLLVTGDKYNTLSSFVNSVGGAVNTPISNKSDFYQYSSAAVSMNQKQVRLDLTTNITVPSSGQYMITVPNICIDSSGYYGGSSRNSNGNISYRLVLCSPDYSRVYRTLLSGGYGVSNSNYSNSSNLNSGKIDVSLSNGTTFKLAVIIDYTSYVDITQRDDVTFNTTIKYTDVSTVQMNETTNNTTIFENGLGYKATTSKYAVIINSDNSSDPVFEARNGNYAIKVCNDGIKIMRNGVWSTL